MSEQTINITELLARQEPQRGVKIALEMVKSLELDFTGLTVLTECASGPYAFTPVLAAMAGAKVFAVGRDSSYGSFRENVAVINHLLHLANASGTVEFFEDTLPDAKWADVDVMTNSGFLRPIQRESIERLKPTAVIPLMWETWEFRPDELDIVACQEHGVAVIGTNENYEKADLYGYPGMLAMRLLFTLGIEVTNNRLALVGGNLTGSLIAETFEKLGLDFDWYTKTGTEHPQRCYPYSELRRLLDTDSLDAVICAESHDKTLLVGKEAVVDFPELAQRHPLLRWGHITGNIDRESLKASGLVHYPPRLMPTEYMSYQPGELGVRIVIELNAAGLKVGEIATRSRLAGKSVTEAIAATVEVGIGMDFEGEFLNFRPQSGPPI